MLVAGHDDTDGPSLYWMDYLASCTKLPFAIHGYGSYFGLSICDKYYHKDLTEPEAVNLLNKIISEVRFFTWSKLIKIHFLITKNSLKIDSKEIPSEFTRISCARN